MRPHPLIRVALRLGIGWLTLLGVVDVLCWGIGSAWRNRRGGGAIDMLDDEFPRVVP